MKSIIYHHPKVKRIVIGCAVLIGATLANGFEILSLYAPSDVPCAVEGSVCGTHTFHATYIDYYPFYTFDPTIVNTTATSPETVTTAGDSTYCWAFGDSGGPPEPPDYSTCYVDFEYTVLVPPPEPGGTWTPDGVQVGGPVADGTLVYQPCGPAE